MIAPEAPGDIDEAQRRVRDEIVGGPRGASSPFPLTDGNGELVGPFGLMVRFPELGGPLQRLGSAIRYATTLTPRAREIAILTVAHATGSSFEAYAHMLVAAQAGLTDTEISALLAGRVVGRDAYERGVGGLARHLLLDGAASRGEHGLDDVVVAEVVALTGYYRLLAQLMAQFGIGAPDGGEDAS